MTETKEFDYKAFAEGYIQLMKDGKFDELIEYPKKLETDEQQMKGIEAVVEAVDAQDDAFKEDNAKVIAMLKEVLNLRKESEANKAEDSSEAATEEPVKVKEAVEPETADDSVE